MIERLATYRERVLQIFGQNNIWNKLLGYAGTNICIYSKC